MQEGQEPWQQTGGPTAFAPFPMDADYFGSPQQAWMVSFRVRSLDAMVAQLRQANIEVKVDPENCTTPRLIRSSFGSRRIPLSRKHMVRRVLHRQHTNEPIGAPPPFGVYDTAHIPS
jgi:hypothetical protein